MSFKRMGLVMNLTEKCCGEAVMFGKQSEKEQCVVQVKNNSGEGYTEKLFKTRMHCEAKTTEVIIFTRDNKAY